MQATQNRPHTDGATVRPLVPPLGPGAWDHRFFSVGWNPWPEAQVRPPMVVMQHPFFQQHPQMFFMQWNQEIQALTAKRSYQPFTVGVRLRRLDWRAQRF